jgi:putative salt-induced outer membrane protein YdiY
LRDLECAPKVALDMRDSIFPDWFSLPSSWVRCGAPSFVLGLALVCLAPQLAAAAPPPPDDPGVPKGTAEQKDATTGSTELGTGDKFSAAKDLGAVDPAAEPVVDPHANDATEFDISLGGIFSTGNSRSLAATGLSNFRLRRTIHQFGASLAGNYGATGVPDTRRYDTTVGNVQGLLRYDVFFARDWTAFLQTTARHDTFQGLDLRVNVDPGFAYYAINQPKHRLWFEAGYDFQYDLRTDESRILLDDELNPVLDMNGDTQLNPAVDKFLINHAARLFAGYSNKLSDKVSFDTGLEYLQSVIVAKRMRLNYLAAINTQLAERFSLAVTFTLRYENDPLPNVRKLDTISAVSLAYRFF